MKNTKLLWGIIGCLLLLVAVLGWNYSRLLGTSKVAVVGDVTITEADWTDELKTLYGSMVLEKMIDRQVVLLQAHKNGLSISNQEIDAELIKMQERFPTSDAFFQTIKNDLGMTPEDIREEIRHYLLLEKIATSDVNIPEQELYRHFQENREKFNQPPLARISAIYVNQKEEADQVTAELKKGADFATLAKERSVEMYSASSGGDLGWVSLLGGDADQAIVDVALTMKEGQASPPIALEKGYAVIRVEQKKPAITRSFDEVKGEIQRELALNQVGSLEQVLKRLKDGLNVQVFQK